MDVNKKIENFIKKVIQIIAIIILVFLFITSIFQTSYMDKTEITQYLPDNPIIHIVSICLVIGLIYFLRKKDIKVSKKIICITVGIWALLTIIWIMLIQLFPRADQKYILNIANDLKHGITTGFEEGKYGFCNPHQIGLILFETMTSFVFGIKYNFLGIQLLNVLAILVSFFAIYKITKILFKNRETSIYTIFALFLFIPITLYVTFVYGNLFGLATSMLSVLFLLLYLEDKKVKNIILSSVCIELAIIFKSNYLVTMIAIICMLILSSISEKRIKTLIPIALFILVYLFGNLMIDTSIKIVTQKEKNDGIPMSSYVAMGLQESKRAPGWYNRYNRSVYEKSGYNSKKASDKIKKDIKQSLEKFRNDPKYAIEFFYKKTISQWNNPTFQSLWIYKMRKSNNPNISIVKAIKGEGLLNKLLTFYMNIVQSLILFGATTYMIIDFKNIKYKQLIFIIIFIGGFLFHIIWEAKGQYTLTYFVLLIPYAVRGFLQLTNR